MAAHQGGLLLERLPFDWLRWWTFAGGAVNSSLALRLGEIGSTREDDLWVETAPGIAVPTRIQRPVAPWAMTGFAEKLAKRCELKFAACLPTDLAAAVLVGRPLDEANFRRLLSG